jgi:hypothetical protein
MLGRTRAIALSAALLSGAALPAAGLWAGNASAAPLLKLPSKTTLSSSRDPSFFGQPVTFTAVVAPLGIGIFDGHGTVGFKNGSFSIPGCSSQSLHFILGSWRAFCTTGALPAGLHTIRATYSGDSHWFGSTKTLTQVVLRAPTHLRANIFFNFRQTFTVTGTLDSFRRPVAHEPLIFRTGHTFLCVAFTNSRGVGACLLSYARSVAIRQNAGRFTVIFPGSANYLPSIAFGQGIIHP